MKKIFTLLTLIAFSCSTAQARHGSWHHSDWLGLGIGIAAVTAIATATTPQVVQQETVIVQQAPTYVAPMYQPAQTIIVERPVQTYVPQVRVLPPPPPPPHFHRPPPPRFNPPPPPRHSPPQPRRSGHRR